MADETDNAYAQKLEGRIEQWTGELDQLRAKVKEKSADARLEYEKRLGDLEHKQQDARSRVDAMRASAGEATEELKRGAQQAVDDLGSSLERARNDFG